MAVLQRSEFALALNQIASERGVSAETIMESIKSAILAAYKKDHVSDENEEEMEAILKSNGHTRTPGVFTEWLKHKAKFKLECFVVRANFRLGKMRKMTERREAFTKLRPWLRRFLIRYDDFYGGLFSSNRKNQKFIEDQIEELGMRQEMLSRRQLRTRFRCSFDW
jgi:hypothetical protein